MLQQPHDPDYSVDSYAECSYAEGDAEDLNLLSQTSMRTMELQWQSYVDKLKEAGSLSNALAICDVSASMYGLPMEVLYIAVMWCARQWEWQLLSAVTAHSDMIL